jgi:mitogen-activated protein kinase 7
MLTFNLYLWCEVTTTLQAQDYIRSLPIKPRVPFSTLFPHANPLAIDVLSQMLCFDPAKRMSCEQALNHPYFQAWHDPIDEPVCATVSNVLF